MVFPEFILNYILVPTYFIITNQLLVLSVANKSYIKYISLTPFAFTKSPPD